jgi:hypothetical protein
MSVDKSATHNISYGNRCIETWEQICNVFLDIWNFLVETTHGNTTVVYGFIYWNKELKDYF